MVAGAEMIHKTPPLDSRNVVKAKRGRIFTLDEDKAFQSGRNDWQRDLPIGDLAAAGNPDLSPADRPSQTLPLLLADFCDCVERDICARCGFEDRTRQRMLRISFQTRRDPKDVLFGSARSTQNFRDRGTTVRQCPRLIEDQGHARTNLFQLDGFLMMMLR